MGVSTQSAVASTGKRNRLVVISAEQTTISDFVEMFTAVSTPVEFSPTSVKIKRLSDRGLCAQYLSISPPAIDSLPEADRPLMRRVEEVAAALRGKTIDPRDITVTDVLPTTSSGTTWQLAFSKPSLRERR